MIPPARQGQESKRHCVVHSKIGPSATQVNDRICRGAAIAAWVRGHCGSGRQILARRWVGAAAAWWWCAQRGVLDVQALESKGRPRTIRRKPGQIAAAEVARAESD
jgi:hypothetical protein